MGQRALLAALVVCTASTCDRPQQNGAAHATAADGEARQAIALATSYMPSIGLDTKQYQLTYAENVIDLLRDSSSLWKLGFTSLGEPNSQVGMPEVWIDVEIRTHRAEQGRPPAGESRYWPLIPDDLPDAEPPSPP